MITESARVKMVCLLRPRLAFIRKQSDSHSIRISDQEGLFESYYTQATYNFYVRAPLPAQVQANQRGSPWINPGCQ